MPSDPGAKELGILSEDFPTIAGRSVYLSVVRVEVVVAPLSAGQTETVTGFTLNDVDRRISYISDDPPFVATVRGNTIEFGGHTFELSTTLGEYVTDGTTVTLPADPAATFAFDNGVYQGSFPYGR